MTDSEKVAYKQGHDKGLERGKVYASAPPPARRSIVFPALTLPLTVAASTLGYLAYTRGQANITLMAEVARLRAESADTKAATDKIGAAATAQASAARAEADRLREQQRQVTERLNQTLAAQQAAKQPPPPQPRPAPRKRSVLDGITPPGVYTPAYIDRDSIQVGLIGEFCLEGSGGRESELQVDRIIDDTTAILRGGVRWQYRFIVANFPTAGLADGKEVPKGRKWKVVGTHREYGSTFFVLIPAEGQ